MLATQTFQGIFSIFGRILMTKIYESTATQILLSGSEMYVVIWVNFAQRHFRIFDYVLTTGTYVHRHIRARCSSYLLYICTGGSGN